jgi:ABC-2 type transport system permease protein
MKNNPIADFFDGILSSRVWALFCKEVWQILHNRQLLIQLVVPPTLMLLLFGFALNPTFKDLRVGITDYSHSRASREFLELFSQTVAFDIRQYYANEQDMKTDLARGKLTVGITVPPEFDRDLARHRPTQVQALFDAVDANTASVASGYLSQLVGDYNSRRLAINQGRQGTGASTPNNPNNASNSSSTINRASTSNLSTLSKAKTATTTANPQSQSENSGTNPIPQRNQVQLATAILYNPGLEASWFIVPGTIGIVLTTIGIQAATSLVVREKSAGTIEQLLMSPASNTEVITAKIIPLLILLTFDAVIAIMVGKIAFNLPFRGNLLIFLGISMLYFLVGISIGILIACYVKSEQQSQLVTFFIIPPIILLSGGSSPIAAMPTYMQRLTYLNPLRYYIEVCRGIFLKGVGLAELWSQVLILSVFAIALLALSIRQFRNQLT